MKKTLLFLMILVGILAQAQPTVLQFGERLPNLYYWDTNWFDSKPLCTDSKIFVQEQVHDIFIGRPCIASAPLRVIGIAAAVKMGSFKNYTVLDTNRLPEYFFLYQVENDSLYFKDSLRWDTIIPQYQMTIPTEVDFQVFDSNWTCDLYMAYFDKPITVHDTFVVGGTTHNNLEHGYDEEMPNNTPWGPIDTYDHTPAFYPLIWRNQCYPISLPKPCYYIVKYYWPWYNKNYTPTLDSWGGFDTTSFQKIYYCNYELWLPFFAIFDTNYVPGYNDSCQAPTGLHIEEQEGNEVSIAWNANWMTEWEISVGKVSNFLWGVVPSVVEDDWVTTTTPINYVTLDSLDTASWYAVRIRTVCEDEYYVPWADTLLIYIPGDTCWKPTWLHVAELDSAMVTLAWNAGETILWEVEMAEDGTELDSGVVMTVDDSSIQVEGLDTSQWYWARVRALCDSDYWSDWTDTIRFLVPNEHPSGPDTTNTINPVEQYTYLMPNPAKEEVTVMSSFRVKKVELFASDGKLLQSKEVNAVGTRLSLEGLPAGVYFVRVTTTAGVTTKRLVKTEN